MGTDLERYEAFPIDIIQPAADLAQRIAKTEFVPSALRNRPEAVLAAILTGHEVGIGPMQALAKIHVIEGRPTQAAELMRALVLSKGHELIVEEYTLTRVILCGRRKESDHVTKVQWDMDMAKKAGLEQKPNWKKYPRAMLLARATGELCRLIFADVIGGISYTPEELTDGDLVFFDEDVESEPPVADLPKETVKRKAAPPRKAAAAKKAAPTTAVPSDPPLPGEEGFDELGATNQAPEDSPEVADDDSATEEEKKLRATVAMHCNKAGLDADGRHNLISAVTNGEKNSSKQLDGEEAAEVIAETKEIAANRKALVRDDEGRWQVIVVEDATDDNFDGSGDEAQWTADKWRRYLADRGVKLTALIRKAQELAPQTGDSPPGNLEQIIGKTSLCSLLRGYVEDIVEARDA